MRAADAPRQEVHDHARAAAGGGAPLRSRPPARDHERARERYPRAAPPPGSPRPGRVAMGAIRTVVVDDEKLARDRLVGFLAGLDDVSPLGQAADGVGALRPS